jgi:hypothetical protein
MQFESLQLKRGEEADNDAYTGPSGEITVDTQNWMLRIHDGVNDGGAAIGTPYQPS